MAPRATPEQSEILRRIGLRAGEEVRFRRADRGRWQEGHISWVERDGSEPPHRPEVRFDAGFRTVREWRVAPREV
ncbi:MAG: hypothetical protein ACO3MH_09885, partial [Ilumatobacteraceae bacterium]